MPPGIRERVRRRLDLPLWQRRAVNIVLAVGALVVASAVAYHYIQVAYEGRTPPFSHSLQVVIETFTGTGFGSDSPWTSLPGNLFVALLDLSTFLLLFIVVPYVFRPVLEEALSPAAPTSADLDDHVLICGTAQQDDRLIREFDSRDVTYAVIEEAEDRALELADAGVDVVHGDPTATDTLQAAPVGGARTIVVDTTDRQSASCVLAVRECNESARTIVLVEDLEHERHIRHAGADDVVTPRHLLGQRIAERIATEISPARSDAMTVGGEFSMLELSVFEESPINGRTLAAIEADAGETVQVIGIWREGTFEGTPDSRVVVDEDAVLLVAGDESEVRALERETHRGRDTASRVVIAGYGIVGSTVDESLGRIPGECLVVDRQPGEGVDVVGDVIEPDTLREAGIEDASILVLTISDDDEAILATLMASELNADLEIIVRTNEAGNDSKVRRAGAGYVLSLAEMSGRVLAQEVLHEDVLSYTRQLETVRIEASELAGTTIAAAGVPAHGAIPIAVERDGELITYPSADFELHAADCLLVVGTPEAIDELPE